MLTLRRRVALATGTVVAANAVLFGLPLPASGFTADLIRDVQRTGEALVAPVRKALPRAVERTVPRAGSVKTAQTPTDGTYQPPLHGATPHGQGTVATLDLQPAGTRPLSGDPAGAGDQTTGDEEVVVGRARGEQDAAGGYNGHITIVALFGNEVLGVDTGPGQTAAGPLDALQRNVLDQLCNGSGNQICLEVLRADSSTTTTGSTNSFAVANARVGGAQGISATAAESNGNISEEQACQTAHGDSTVASASAGGNAVADVARSSSDSRACRDGAPTRESTSQVIALGGQGVPIPAAGCATGVPDTETGIPTLLPIVCNPDDSSGAGEAVAQAAAPYGVREALTVFALEAGGTALLKATTSGSESRASAPLAPAGVTPEPVAPRGPEEPGDREEPGEPDEGGPGGPGGPGEPDQPQVKGARAEALPRTGADLVLIALLASVLLGGGLALRRAVERWEPA